MRRLPFLFVIATLLLGYTSPAQAQTGTQVDQITVSYQFGESITFKARLHSNLPIEEIKLYIKEQGNSHTTDEPMVITSQGEATYVQDLTKDSLRAFATVNYWVRVKLQGGEVYTSPSFSFYYEDNRFNWQVLDEKPFYVHWYSGDEAFGQSVLEVTQAGLKRVQGMLSLAPVNDVNIYVYASSREMQEALNQRGQDWVAGHADPAQGVILVTLPAGPDQRLLTEQRIPHELAHILLYQFFKDTYTNLPTWLNEGLASDAELYPNPDYEILLQNALQKSSLLPINSLCQTFPRDASNALLAYAESASFTRYLQSRFGGSGLQALASNYADGMDCNAGAQAALGKDLTQLELQWRQESLSENTLLTALKNLLPWFILLLGALSAPLAITIGKLRKRPVHDTPGSSISEESYD